MPVIEQGQQVGYVVKFSDKGSQNPLIRSKRLRMVKINVSNVHTVNKITKKKCKMFYAR